MAFPRPCRFLGDGDALGSRERLGARAPALCGALLPRCEGRVFVSGRFARGSLANSAGELHQVAGPFRRLSHTEA